jgi:hypothetical protein
VKKNGKQGHEHDATTQAGERSEKSRHEGDDRDDGGEFQDGHFQFLLRLTFLFLTAWQKNAGEGQNRYTEEEADDAQPPR